MALDLLNSNNLEQLALKGLMETEHRGTTCRCPITPVSCTEPSPCSPH